MSGGVNPVPLALLLGGLAVCAFVRLPILHPLQIWYGSWAVGVGLYAMKLLPYVDLSRRTTIVLAASTLGFGVAALVAEWAVRRRTSGWSLGSVKARSGVVASAAAIALILTALGLAVFLAQVTRDFGLRAALGFSSEVRKSVVGQDIVARYVPFAMAAAALSGLAAGLSGERATRRRWVVFAALAAASLYFTTGRQLIVSAIITALAAYGLVAPHWLTRRRVAYAAAGVVVVALAVFMVLGQVKDPRYGEDDSPTFHNVFAEHRAFGQLAVPYEHASASVAALNVQVAMSKTWGRAYGCASLPPACRMANRVGVETASEPPARPFTAAPLSWNTYTFLDAPLIDFGVVLAPVAVSLFGAIVGSGWALARRRVVAAQATYAMVVPGLVFASRQNFVAEMIVWSTLSVVLLLVARAIASLRANQGRGQRFAADPS